MNESSSQPGAEPVEVCDTGLGARFCAYLSSDGSVWACKELHGALRQAQRPLVSSPSKSSALHYNSQFQQPITAEQVFITYSILLILNF